MKNKIDKKTVKKGLLPYLFLFIIILGIFYVFNFLNKEVHEFTYNEFVEKLYSGKITELNLVARGNGYIYEVNE